MVSASLRDTHVEGRFTNIREPLLCFAPSSASSIDPEQERSPPPEATLVYFPQNDLDVHSFQSDDAWEKHIPNLFAKYSHVSRPSEVTLDHLKALNISVEGDVALENLVPLEGDGHSHLPLASAPTAAQRASMHKGSVVASTVSSQHHKHPLLSNGHKAPDDEAYQKYAREMSHDNEDAFRVLQKRKPRPGHQAPHIAHFRRFWSQLEVVATYWDTSLDHYYEAGSEPSPRSKSPKGFKRLSMALTGKDSLSDAHKPTSGQRYKGRRTSTGSKMPDQFRVDLVRNLIEPLASAFGCVSINPKKVPQMEIGSLRLPVTQTSVIWRNSQDKASSKRGVTEGPLLGLQCRGETGFIKNHHVAALDAAREIAGLLLLAEERAREGKAPILPGEGKWWVNTPRWGGGPGGEFGDADGSSDHPPPTSSTTSTAKRHTVQLNGSSGHSRSKSEEDIWKELKPGPGLFDPTHTYLAVGKDRTQPFDNCFMISSLFHHIAILKLTVHPSYIEFLTSGRGPQIAPPTSDWYKPRIQRTRWYDLLDPEDRSEAFRGLWGVMSYIMRAGDNVVQSSSQRQKSDSHQHHFSFRRKSLDMTPNTPLQKVRSNSVAF